MKITEQPSAQRARFVAGSFRLRVIYFNDSIGRIVKKVILVKLVNVVPRHDRPVITFRLLVVGDDGPLPTVRILCWIGTSNWEDPSNIECL
jgi:hypothetical protein